MKLPTPPLLVITQRRETSAGLVATCAAALAGGARWILYRDPDTAADERMACARSLRALTRENSAWLFISHDAELAQSIKADGLHLKAGQSLANARRLFSGPIGQSCHSRDELAHAAQNGAAYASLSPVFASPGKPGYGPALGLTMLRDMATEFPALPLIALGGINAENAAACRNAGAAGVAVRGAISAAASPAAATAEIVTALAV